jgi:hypothetical protein
MFTVNVEYRQFYVFDEEVSPPYPEDITDRDISIGLKATPNLLAIYPLRDGAVTVDVVVDAEPPSNAGADWNHVVEAQLDIPSGCIVIASPTDFLPECPRMDVRPGSYLARVISQRGESAEQHRFSIHLSPGTCESAHVIRGEVDENA